VRVALLKNTSSLLEKAAFHKSDREALLSDWHYVSDDLWSAYFSTEYAALNTKEQNPQNAQAVNH